MLIGCIRCHGPLDGEDNCPICDAPDLLDDVINTVLRGVDDLQFTVHGQKLPSLRATVFGKERAEIRSKLKAVLIMRGVEL